MIRKRAAQEPKYFDDAQKQELVEKFANSDKPIMAEQMKKDRPIVDETPAGVKTYNSVRKNANSVADYHILSNLTNEQHEG